MMNDLVLRGGSVLTPEGVVVADVGVSNGVIAALGTTVGEGKTTLDVTGCWVGPALVDIHTHLREPGQEWKEDVESGGSGQL